jgi:hypothetical protein
MPESPEERDGGSNPRLDGGIAASGFGSRQKASGTRADSHPRANFPVEELHRSN